MLARMGSLDATRLRALIDTHTPRLARAYRRTRDAFHASRYEPEATGLGFSILRGSEYANRLVGSELPAFRRCVAEADLFVDVGANVGFFTLLSSRSGLPVLAIEPSPLNLRHLYENLRHVTGSATVEILPIAVSDTAGLAELFGSGQGASLQRGWGGIASNYGTIVPTSTLDLILAGREGRLLIKIDVEGNEDAVLRGAASTLTREPRPTWLVEHGPEVHEGYEGLFEEFWTQGYRIVALPETPGRDPFPVDPETVAAWRGLVTAPELMFLCEPT
jgi:FkbM family methyltransferase